MRENERNNGFQAPRTLSTNLTAGSQLAVQELGNQLCGLVGTAVDEGFKRLLRHVDREQQRVSR